MCHIVFEKAKGHGGTLTERVFMLKQPSEGFFRKDFMRNFAEFQENICAGISFLVFSCEFCKICKNTIFCRTAPNDCF